MGPSHHNWAIGFPPPSDHQQQRSSHSPLQHVIQVPSAGSCLCGNRGSWCVFPPSKPLVGFTPENRSGGATLRCLFAGTDDNCAVSRPERDIHEPVSASALRDIFLSLPSKLFAHVTWHSWHSLHRATQTSAKSMAILLQKDIVLLPIPRAAPAVFPIGFQSLPANLFACVGSPPGGSLNFTGDMAPCGIFVMNVFSFAPCEITIPAPTALSESSYHMTYLCTIH